MAVDLVGNVIRAREKVLGFIDELEKSWVGIMSVEFRGLRSEGFRAMSDVEKATLGIIRDIVKNHYDKLERIYRLCQPDEPAKPDIQVDIPIKVS